MASCSSSASMSARPQWQNTWRREGAHPRRVGKPFFTTMRSPSQNGYAERLIGSIRRDCLDHVVVFGEQHLRHLLNSYQKYYNEVRTHLSLKKDAPLRREVQRVGRVLPVPVLSGLHHRYVR